MNEENVPLRRETFKKLHWRHDVWRWTFSTLLAAGSSEQWLGSMATSAPGQSRWAMSAATALMKPSMTTGTPQIAPPMNRPAMPQISNPPI